MLNFKCKIYSDFAPGYEDTDQYTIGVLHLDIDSVSAFHAADDKRCTIVYSQGFSHEIFIPVRDFERLKNRQKPVKSGFLIFSNN